MSDQPAPQQSIPPSRPGDGNCLLFAYGQLQPQYRAPRTLVRAWPDRMRGLLYDLGPYPAAVQIGCTDQWFQGYTLEIKLSELIAELDPFEQLDQGVYRRIRAVTEAGFEVWIYEYARPLGLGAIGPIHRWPPLPCGGS